MYDKILCTITGWAVGMMIAMLVLVCRNWKENRRRQKILETVVTGALLKANGACDAHAAKFGSLYPIGAQPSYEVLRQLADNGVDICWYAERMLTHRQRLQVGRVRRMACAARATHGDTREAHNAVLAQGIWDIMGEEV